MKKTLKPINILEYRVQTFCHCNCSSPPPPPASYKIGMPSTCPADRRNTKREGREVAIITGGIEGSESLTTTAKSIVFLTVLSMQTYTSLGQRLGGRSVVLQGWTFSIGQMVGL